MRANAPQRAALSLDRCPPRRRCLAQDLRLEGSGTQEAGEKWASSRASCSRVMSQESPGPFAPWADLTAHWPRVPALTWLPRMARKASQLSLQGTLDPCREQ